MRLPQLTGRGRRVGVSGAAAGRFARVRCPLRAVVAIDSLGRHGVELRGRQSRRCRWSASISRTVVGQSFSFPSTGGAREGLLQHT
jgi:hypothetical protein